MQRIAFLTHSAVRVKDHVSCSYRFLKYFPFNEQNYIGNLAYSFATLL